MCAVVLWRTSKEPINPKGAIMGRSRYKFYDQDRPYFMTCSIVNWLPLFASPAVVQIIIDSLKFLQTEKQLLLYAYVIMENHLHLIAASAQLGKDIAAFKSFTARTIIDYLKAKQAHSVLRLLNFYKLRPKKDRDYQVWQEGSHPQVILSEAMMLQKIQYIHNNPVKRGYIEVPEHWRYSSARNYADLPSVLEISRY
jgi:REP element-mobilizing transposase RayT